jgi:peptidyl-prolyl cis-trans isomerase C
MLEYLRGTTLSVLLLFLLASCSTTPDIPDEEEAISYRSTDETKTPESPVVAKTDPAPASGGVGRAQGPVAMVEGKPIPADVYNKELDRLLASQRVPPEMMSQVPERLTQQLVIRQLILQKIKAENIQITDAQLESKVKELRADFERTQKVSAGPKMSFEQALQAMGMDPKNYKASLREGLEFEALLKKGGYKETTAAEAKTYYEQNPKQFQQPEQVRASHILIKVEGEDPKAWSEAKTRIEAIRTQATAKDADFAALAKQSSEGPSKDRGGDLGFFGRKQMVPAFDTAVFSMKKGEVSAPVRTKFGWHIILKTDERKARTLAFDEIGEPLRRRLNQQKFQRALQNYVKGLRDGADVKLMLENIK